MVVLVQRYLSTVIEIYLFHGNLRIHRIESKYRLLSANRSSSIDDLRTEELAIRYLQLGLIITETSVDMSMFSVQLM